MFYMLCIMKRIVLTAVLCLSISIIGWCASKSSGIELSVFHGSWFDIEYPKWWDVYSNKEGLANFDKEHKGELNQLKEWINNISWFNEFIEDWISITSAWKELWRIDIKEMPLVEPLDLSSVPEEYLSSLLDFITEKFTGIRSVKKEIYNNEKMVWFIYDTVWEGFDEARFIAATTFIWSRKIFIMFNYSSLESHDFMLKNHKGILDSFRY